MDTRRLPFDTDGIAAAAGLLAEGCTVAFPTETVYGLGADATNGKAVAAIYAAKGRPSFNPLIVHVHNLAQARTLAAWTDAADKLANAFWPGPLTLVLPLPAQNTLSDLVSAGNPSVAVRIPARQAALDLLAAFGKPLAAPSANLSGKISATTADHVLEGLNGRIAAVLDDGPCAVGVESTIVGMTDIPRLLRPGGLAVDAIEALLGSRLATAPDGISAPGQLASHYAPDAHVRLGATSAQDGEYMIGFGPVSGDVNLSCGSDLNEAAANLFGYLHLANASGRPIAVAPVPNTGLGFAINDRLGRAAAPR